MNRTAKFLLFQIYFFCELKGIFFLYLMTLTIFLKVATDPSKQGLWCSQKIKNLV